MGKVKRSEPQWALLHRAFAREMKLSKKALKKAVEEATVRLVAERIAEERLKGSVGEVNRMAKGVKKRKKSTSGRTR
jgi:hypothetical protein